MSHDRGREVLLHAHHSANSLTGLQADQLLVYTQYCNRLAPECGTSHLSQAARALIEAGLEGVLCIVLLPLGCMRDSCTPLVGCRQPLCLPTPAVYLPHVH